ncbi:MAG: NINE protein [Leptolyngbyaceae cyanobacterium SL_1_1]|nr:NINE protein [Leptolyngbyaceae cyanobacterium RM2_2_21]NJN01477.1 NINE protein [Leptolyngbyaceae cyanobacterium RM1_1_2]NJO08422.1 NINE protein [Leptolyngbyaceae cyanobacterium SL_1_1]
MLAFPRNRKMAAALAILSALGPTPIPISGLHKFYLGQPVWGVFYLLLGWTQIPRIASAIEGVWYLMLSDEAFRVRLTPTAAFAKPEAVAPQQVSAIAEALREIDRLRQEGLISEYEFEQKRRSLLDQIA